ncbi:MAG: hypothetical protein LBG25_01775 [Spirochaetaceae bacterium]|jgi:hypothetical protein|nr:hypothetical protein [Spirochaetaceae bacterium]
MRCFLCPFDQFALGIPEDMVAAIMIYSGEVTEIVSQDEGGNSFFSLPHYFTLADRMIHHGVVLKPPDQGIPQNNGAVSEPEEGPRNILLVNFVEQEVDIPPGDIYPLPELLLAPEKFSFFTGIAFLNSTMIVLLDPASLIAQILRNREGGAA